MSRQTRREVQPEMPLNLWSAEREAELRVRLVGRTDLLPVELDLLAALIELERRAERILELEVETGECAPAPWASSPSGECLWERAVSETRSQDEDGSVYDECPDGYLLVWGDGRWQYLGGGGELLAEGTARKVLLAMRAAEAAVEDERQRRQAQGGPGGDPPSARTRGEVP
jgi:hypothetical protein